MMTDTVEIRPEQMLKPVRQTRGRHRADDCVGIFRSRLTGLERDCAGPVTHEAMRSCHGELKIAPVCDRHAADLASGKPSGCRICGPGTVQLVALLPMGGGQ